MEKMVTSGFAFLSAGTFTRKSGKSFSYRVPKELKAPLSQVLYATMKKIKDARTPAEKESAYLNSTIRLAPQSITDCLSVYTHIEDRVYSDWIEPLFTYFCNRNGYGSREYAMRDFSRVFADVYFQQVTCKAATDRVTIADNQAVCKKYEKMLLKGLAFYMDARMGAEFSRLDS